MKLAIAVGNNIAKENVWSILARLAVPASLVLAGTQRDGLLRTWAEQHTLPVETILAHTRYQREQAVYIRNERIAMLAEQGLIIYNGKSTSLEHLMRRLRAHNKPLTVYRVEAKRVLRLDWNATPDTAPRIQKVTLYAADAARAAPCA